MSPPRARVQYLLHAVYYIIQYLETDRAVSIFKRALRMGRPPSLNLTGIARSKVRTTPERPDEEPSDGKDDRCDGEGGAACAAAQRTADKIA
jgi:hypothetical protein